MLIPLCRWGMIFFFVKPSSSTVSEANKSKHIRREPQISYVVSLSFMKKMGRKFCTSPSAIFLPMFVFWHIQIINLRTDTLWGFKNNIKIYLIPGWVIFTIKKIPPNRKDRLSLSLTSHYWHDLKSQDLWNDHCANGFSKLTAQHPFN